MERGKASNTKRSVVKGKAVHLHGDLIALGSKPSRPAPDADSKPTSLLQSKKSLPPLSAPISERKREALALEKAAAKKPKLHGPSHSSQTFTPLGRPLESERKASPTPHTQQYDEVAKEVDAGQLLDEIQEAEDCGDDHEIERLLCGAIRMLKMNRAKPDPAIYLTLMWLAKSRPAFFESELVIEALCSLLKRELTVSYKAKGNAVIPVMTCNVLMTAFQDEENWPDSFIKVFMEDSFGERVWIDRPECKQFVDNIQTAFNTKIPKVSLAIDPMKPEVVSGSPSPVIPQTEDESIDLYALADDGGVNVFPRYTYQQVSVETFVMDMIREQLNRRQPGDSQSRNLLRVMIVACGYSEVRSIAAQKLEMWLQNPKLSKSAQDLLMAVCLNCDQHSQYDVEMMTMLCKIRLKTKPLINHYMLCIRELLNQHESNLQTLLRQTIYNELSTSRNPNNMSLIATIFSHDSSQAAKILAEIFQDLLANKDDYLRALRTLLREIVRMARHDMNFPELTLGLMKQRTESKFVDLEQALKDRMLLSLTDIIAMAALLTIGPTVREAATAQARGDIKDLEVLRTFQNQLALIQRDAVWWLQSEVPTMFNKIRANDYNFCLRKLLFLEKPETYFKVDNWPPESDRGMMLGLATDVPAMEDTIMRILLIGLTSSLQVTPADALDLADMLVRRAAPLHADGFEVLQVERIELIDAVLNLCTYHYPDNITLPAGYEPPTLAITNLYWKAWIMLLIIAAYNPSTFGLKAWQSYPSLSCFMEMTMTSHFKFPPPTMVTHDKATEDIKSKEKQIADLEKQEILEFETHLAAATTKVTITESSSLLLSQVTSMDPSGPARKPPVQVLEQLKQLNKTLRLGSLLCRSRNPDFLLDIIRRQGTSQSMPWLADLVDSNEGSLEVLPVQCLCEFLLHDAPEDVSRDLQEQETKEERHKRRQKKKKHQQLLYRLQSLVHSESPDSHILAEILGFFFQRLCSNQTTNRLLAVKGLSMVLSRSEIDKDNPMGMDVDNSCPIPSHVWLLEQLPSLPQFPVVKETACTSLREACQVDTEVNAVSAYIIFLATHTKDMQLQEMGELVLDLAQLIVERSTLISNVLPQDVSDESDQAQEVLRSFIDLFITYLECAQQPQEEAYSWSNTREQVLLQWGSGESATMNILVVHAMVILLTFGKPKVNSRFEDLLDKWFPIGERSPSAFLVDTSEEALLLPDWLKLRMIRSKVERLVDSALEDLEPAQLLLFVQSFGLPLQSMSKLLQCLDKATQNAFEAMEAALVDKGFVMAQLVEVQHMRGATGGDVFYKMLKQEPPTEQRNDAEMKPSPRKVRTMSQLQRAPDIAVNIQENLQLKEIIFQIFGANRSKLDRQQSYKSLQKLIRKERKIREPLLLIVHQVLRSAEAGELMKGLNNNLHLTSSLFRSFLKANEGSSQSVLVSVLRVFLSGGTSFTALATMAHKMLSQLTGESLKSSVQAQVCMLESAGLQTEQKFQRCVSSMTQNGDPRLEMFSSIANTKSVQQEEVADRTESVCHLLKQPNICAASQSQGLLVDWLELLDPDIIDQCPDIEKQLLFGTESDSDRQSKYQRSPHAYLLVLLVHQSDWASLRNCVSTMLENATDRINASTVLDFLWACNHIPKLWQGRDKKLPKHYTPEDVLQLTQKQLTLLTDYILSEGCSLLKSHDCKPHDRLPNEIIMCMERRQELLLRCCCGNVSRINAAVSHINEALRLGRFNSAICKELLMQMYLKQPSLLSWIPEPSDFTQDISIIKASTTWLDSVSHQLLSSLGNTAPGKQCESRMYDANIACRKLVAEHPILVLRQLPMIAALLQGRSQFTFGEMKNRNNLLLYTHILGVLELLQPYVFHPEYHAALEDIFDAYFMLLKGHGLEHKHLASVVTKFVKFLSNFVSHDSQKASEMLHKYIEILSALGFQYPDFTTLKSLLATLSLPRQPTAEEETCASAPLQPPPRPSSPWSIAQVSPFLKKIRLGASTSDVLEVLKDLDETSKRKVDILDHFLGDLRRLLSDTCESIRNTSHMLIMRHLRQNPRSADEFVGALLHCLESDKPDVINSTLKNLPEFSLLAQGNAIPLLQKAFDVGTKSKIESESTLGEALQLLNMDTVI